MVTYTKITPTESARADAADSIQRAISRGGMPQEVNDGLRNLSEQKTLFNENYTPDYQASSKLDRRWYEGRPYYRRSPYRYYVAVAVPGTSNHGTGVAADFGHRARAWMFKNGAYYGWTNPAWAKRRATFEPWHWEYNSRNDKSKGLWADMPSRNYFNRTTDQALAPGKWTTVRINNKGYVSSVTGAKATSAATWVQISGIPEGEQFQIRQYIVEYNDKSNSSKRINILERSLSEHVGTAGTSFAKTTVMTGMTNGSQRLRAEVWVPSAVKGAKIVNAQAEALVW